MNDEMLEQLQTKIAFLERANADLSDVVIRQQQELRMLDARIRDVSERIDTERSEDRERLRQDERPPHY